MNKAIKIIRYSLAIAFFAISAPAAFAQGWPTFDVSHTASEITGLVSDIQKVYQMPMEIQSLGDLTSSVGGLGIEIGMDPSKLKQAAEAKKQSGFAKSVGDFASKAKDGVDKGIDHVKTKSNEFKENVDKKKDSAEAYANKQKDKITSSNKKEVSDEEAAKDEGVVSGNLVSSLKEQAETTDGDEEKAAYLQAQADRMAERAEKLSQMKATFGGVGVSLDGTPLTYEAQSGSVSDTVDYIKNDSGEFLDTEGAETAEAIAEVKATRLQNYVDANKEAYALAVSMRANGPDDLKERIDEINTYNEDAEDKRKTLTANTLLMVAICNELIDMATLSVADLKTQATSEIYSLNNIYPTVVDEE